jgi:SEC-C motif-containing protein
MKHCLLILVVALCGLLSSEAWVTLRPTHQTTAVSLRTSTSLAAGFGAKKEVVDVKVSPPATDACACGSGKGYGECCGVFHSGEAFPAEPPKVVRSRFSALAYKDIDYVMATTHPKHKEYALEEQAGKLKKWKKALLSFAKEYEFISLEFDDETAESTVSDDQLEAKVTFKAQLKSTAPMGSTETITETSTFKRADANSKWLYIGESFGFLLSITCDSEYDDIAQHSYL